jgi:hypothetical protein
VRYVILGHFGHFSAKKVGVRVLREKGSSIRDRCYYFLNNFAKKIGEKMAF